jgi:hypothetical protein
VYFAMAFSFGVEMLNMNMMKRRRKKAAVELRGPKFKEEAVSSKLQ